MTSLEDMNGKLFTEGDYVLFADALKSLRVARVRGIKAKGAGFNVALDIVNGIGTNKKRYSRAYFPHDFFKLNPTDVQEQLDKGDEVL